MIVIKTQVDPVTLDNRMLHGLQGLEGGEQLVASLKGKSIHTSQDSYDLGMLLLQAGASHPLKPSAPDVFTADARRYHQAGQELVRDAARQGHGDALNDAGVLHMENVFPYNTGTAVMCFMRAVNEQKHPEAILNMGLLDLLGWGTKRNLTRAHERFGKARASESDARRAAIEGAWAYIAKLSCKRPVDDIGPPPKLLTVRNDAWLTKLRKRADYFAVPDQKAG